jgi:hypothetical protein
MGVVFVLHILLGISNYLYSLSVISGQSNELFIDASMVIEVRESCKFKR